jgi:hypothetical protein
MLVLFYSIIFCKISFSLFIKSNSIFFHFIPEVWAEFALNQRNPHAAALGELPGTGPPPFQHFTQNDGKIKRKFGEL